MKLHNIHVTPNIGKKVMTDLDFSKASSPNWIPVVVLQNCEPELSYVSTDLFNMSFEESCSPSCWKDSFVVPAFLVHLKQLEQ